MTTMSEPGTQWAGQNPGPVRILRRSATDRVISGVSGGLGRYFGVDPVIFRVLFAVLSFFGGVGVLAYGIAWLLIPEPDAETSMLDKALHELRVRKVPPWLVVLGGAVVVWIAWFSWWAPGTLPAILLLAVVVLVLMHRLVNRPQPMPTSPPWAGGVPDTAPWAQPKQDTAMLWPTTEDQPDPTENPQPLSEETPLSSEGPVPLVDETAVSTESPVSTETPVSLSKESPVTDTSDWRIPYVPFGAPSDPDRENTGDTRLIPPLADSRRTMQAWLSEASEAHQTRVRRRRPIKVAVWLALLVGWGFVGMLDAFTRVPFPAYLWTGLAIFGAGLVISLVTRRMMLSLLIPLLVLAAVAVGLGGTRASLSDGSGDIGWKPTTTAELGTYRQFAGRSTLDLAGLPSLTSATDVTITQAAGAVTLQIPKGMNATVIADVHLGEIQNGTSKAVGDYQTGMNVRLQLNPPSTATGAMLTIHVHLTDGRVLVNRV